MRRVQACLGALSGRRFIAAFAGTGPGADYRSCRRVTRASGMQRAAADAPSAADGTRVSIAGPDLEAALRRMRVEREWTALSGDGRWFALFRGPSGVSSGIRSDRIADAADFTR